MHFTVPENFEHGFLSKQFQQSTFLMNGLFMLQELVYASRTSNY